MRARTFVPRPFCCPARARSGPYVQDDEPMTEITRVPLQPIARGSLSKLWLGIAAAVLVAGGVAWAAMPAQVSVSTITAGHGPSPTVADVAVINYKGTLDDGK